MFKLDLSQITDHSACTTDHFFKKSNGATVIEYPNGWQESDSIRVAKESPVSFLWLVSKKLIPVGFLEASKLLDDVYGKDKSAVICKDFASAAPRPKNPEFPARRVTSSLDAPKADGSLFDTMKSFRTPDGASAGSSSPKPAIGSLIESLSDVVRPADKKSILGALLKKNE